MSNSIMLTYSTEEVVSEKIWLHHADQEPQSEEQRTSKIYLEERQITLKITGGAIKCKSNSLEPDLIDEEWADEDVELQYGTPLTGRLGYRIKRKREELLLRGDLATGLAAIQNSSYGEIELQVELQYRTPPTGRTELQELQQGYLFSEQLDYS
ncbi:hypothetical protein B296_00036371 [Ensete ventricosum]|uniref:Uncharacterized protein n=1 Tax=Ensete ventricosum TaxID=4639 RepID=A0A426YQ28_ENSVE|nr:hypothetical protein B296_00036371 [Ensete ventricosum]